MSSVRITPKSEGDLNYKEIDMNNILMTYDAQERVFTQGFRDDPDWSIAEEYHQGNLWYVLYEHMAYGGESYEVCKYQTMSAALEASKDLT